MFPLKAARLKTDFTDRELFPQQLMLEKGRFMELFPWSEKYSVNIAEIDKQHKKLVGMLNKLHNAICDGKGKEALGPILSELIQYTRTHFIAEERIMSTNGYPDYEAHKEKHRRMSDKVALLYRDYQEGKASLNFEVMDFLEKWIEKHIMGTDKKYAPFLNNKGIF